MKALLLILLALVFPAWAAEFAGESLETIRKNIAAKRAVLVDTRGQEEWNDGHVEGAIFLPMNRLRRMEAGELEQQLPKDKVIYTHCVVGMRARAVAKVLERHGYNTRPIKQGYDDLISAGFKKAGD
jgi:rhodanese-related sulfurtransferase